MAVDPRSVARILGGQRTLGRTIRTVRELQRAVEIGLPVEALDVVVRHLTASAAAASALKYRIVPRTTLHRRRRLNVEESQRLERLARMTAVAERVWEDADQARTFLTTPQPQLDGERPVDLARSDIGTRRVEELLHKVEYALPV